jgi:hypothetical protein
MRMVLVYKHLVPNGTKCGRAFPPIERQGSERKTLVHRRGSKTRIQRFDQLINVVLR